MAAPRYSDLVNTLERLRARVMTRLFARGAFAALAWVAAWAAVALILQGLAGPRLDVGILLAVALAAIATRLLWRHVVTPLRRFPTLRQFAAEVDRVASGPVDAVINALDLGKRRDAEPDPISRSLIDHAVAEGTAPAMAVVPSTLDRGPRLRPYAIALAIAIVGVTIFALLAPMRFRASLLALLHPVSFPYAPEVVVSVPSGGGAVDSGADFAVSAEVTGTEEPARLVYRKEGGAWKSVPMTLVADAIVPWKGHLDGSQVTVTREIPQRSYRASLTELRRDTEYRVRAGRHDSELFDVEVLTPPRVAAYVVHADYPDYAGLADETIRSATGDVALLTGTDVTCVLETEGHVGRAEIEWSDGRPTDVTTTGDGASFAFRVDARAEYRVRLFDPEGRRRFESPFFAVDAVPDQNPLVRLLAPGEDVDVPDGMELPIVVSCTDDYGLSRLLLHVHKEPYEPFSNEVRTFEVGTRDEVVEFVWDLSSLELMPGESATYYLELFDTDTVSGPKSARTPVYQVRFPSMAELYSRVEEEYSENVVGSLDEVLEEQQQLRDRVEATRRELERARDGITYERQKEIEALMESQSNIQDELSQALDALQRSMDRLSETDMTSFQIMERMEQIQALLQQVDSERMNAMLEEVKKALQDMDERELQEALEAFEFTQDEMLQQLDRSLEHLEKILAEQKLEAIVDELQALLEEQAEISDQLEALEDAESTDASDADASDADAAEDDAAEDDAAEDDLAAASDTETDDAAQAGDTENASETDSETDPSAAGDAESDVSDSESTESDVADATQSEADADPSETSATDPQDGSDSESGEDASQSDSESDETESPSGQSEGQSSEGSPPSDSPSMEELAELQEALAQRAEEIAERIEELRELSKQSHQALDQALQQQSPETGMQQAQESMENAASEMQQSEQEPALRYTLKAQEQIQSLMSGMQGAMQAMQANQTSELSKQMLAVGAELLHLSTKQETVSDGPGGASTRDLAAGQMRVYEATGRASERLHEIGKETLFISQAMLLNMGAILDDMSRATTQFEGGNRARGARDAAEAMTGLNEAVMDIIRANEQMQSSGGSCSNPSPSAMSRLPTLTGMQKQLNQQTMSLAEQLARQRLSPQAGQAAMKQLAARQEAIRRGLAEISEELEGRRDVLGRLDELGGELEDVVEEMSRGNVDRKLVERQQKILSRLLAAEKSIRKQDEDERRLSRSADEVERTTTPAALDADDMGETDALNREIMQGRTDPYPARYRGMIDAYFKALGEGDGPRRDAEDAGR